jgi:hypothetical protein
MVGTRSVSSHTIGVCDYFIPCDEIKFHADSFGAWIGFQFVHKQVGDGVIYSPIVELQELFLTCYRSKRCSKCSTTKPHTNFYWKVKGTEGPFRSLWSGRRQSTCMDCESKVKAKEHISRVKRKNPSRKQHPGRIVRVIDPRGMKIVETPIDSNVGQYVGLQQILADLVLEVRRELIEKTAK